MATINYLFFDGKKVSEEWFYVLRQAREEGVAFHLNSGHRTMDEQWFLWNHRGQPGFASIVAFPSAIAPHIRIGRPDHALDVDTSGNGANNLAGWLRSKGARVTFTVAGEPWHEEIDPNDLQRLYKRYFDITPNLHKGDTGPAVARAQKLIKDRGFDIKVDGSFGSQTVNAIHKIYASYGYAKFDHIGDTMWQILQNKHPWRWLTSQERIQLATLEAGRRLAKKEGGWKNLSKGRQNQTHKAIVYLRNDIKEMRENAKRTGWKINHRGVRHNIVCKIVL